MPDTNTQNNPDDNQENENELDENEGAENEGADDQGGDEGGNENLSAEQLAVLEEEENFILNFKDEDWEDPEKAKRANALLMKNQKTTISQKRHFRTKAQKLEEQSKNGGQGGKENKDKNEKKETGASAERLEFRQDHTDIPREAVDEIEKYAKAHNQTMEQALSGSLFLQSFVKQVKEKKKNESAGLGGNSGRKPNAGGGKDWSQASPQEIEKERNRIMGIPH